MVASTHCCGSGSSWPDPLSFFNPRHGRLLGDRTARDRSVHSRTPNAVGVLRLDVGLRAAGNRQQQHGYDGGSKTVHESRVRARALRSL